MSGLPADFVWGVSTSAAQIEGACETDGRGESIWDRFARVPGAIAAGESPEVATDHYRRWSEDIGLIAGLGVTAYRFSVAWPRVVPDGHGAVNPAGLDFYDRLVDGLLEAGVEPVPTLYHWDLPATLQDRGGWPQRDTAEAFAEYAAHVAGRLGDRVGRWITINEPWVASVLGHERGIHAPGAQSRRAALRAGHHLLLGHARAMTAIRDIAPGADVGIAINLEPKIAASAHPADRALAEIEDAMMNRWFLDPLAGRDYPPEAAEALGWDPGTAAAGDAEAIGAPVDFLGVNYYTRAVVKNPAVPDADRPEPIEHAAGGRTEMGWEVAPRAFGDLLIRLASEYDFPAYLITENGMAAPDRVADDGSVDDADRIAYLEDHLAEVERAAEAGVPMAGYFVWSLMDNFEWERGYAMRFGLVHVDYETLERTPKASAAWYRDRIAAAR